MEIITDNRKLPPMAPNACGDKVGMPDFQRDFVWVLDAIGGEERRG
jgi:hypothetical protein